MVRRKPRIILQRGHKFLDNYFYCSIYGVDLKVENKTDEIETKWERVDVKSIGN